MNGVGAMVDDPDGLVAVAPSFALPNPAPPPPGEEAERPCRFAGEPVHWLRIADGDRVRAFARASRRVYTRLSPGLPGDAAAEAALIEVSPLPGFIAGALRNLAAGLPVQYVLLAATDAAAIPDPEEEIAVDVEEGLLSTPVGCWIAICFQKRICLDPPAWVAALDAAAEAGGTPRSADWPAFVAGVTSTGGTPLRLLDHVGRPLQDGAFELSEGGATRSVSPDSGAVEIGDGGADLAVPGATGAILASAEGDNGMLAEPLALTGLDRHVLVSDAGAWFAERSAGVTGMPRWTAGNEVEPIVDGTPYFSQLVPALREAKGGGAVQLAGWAFVKEALGDSSKTWPLLPGDDSTELVALVDELISGGADVRLLATRFLQMTDEEIVQAVDEAQLVLLIVFFLALIAHMTNLGATNLLGWTLLWGAMPLLDALSEDALRLPLRALLEYSTAAVEAINDSHPGTAVWTPYPAGLDDNPLAPRPVEILGENFDFVSKTGAYHQKIAMARPPGGAPIAFVGGIDINSDRVDTPLHRAAAPFHDVQVRLAGPVVDEVAKTVAERATFHGATAPIQPVADPGSIPHVGRHVVQIGRTYFKPGPGSANVPLPSAPQGEITTRDTLLAAIANARDFIYIEDQYFTPSDAYVEALADAAHSTPARALVVTVPARADQPFGTLRRSDVIGHLAEHWGERFRIGAPIRRYLNPSPDAFSGLGRLILGEAADADADQLLLGPAGRVPVAPFWAFVEGELVYVSDAIGGPDEGSSGGEASGAAAGARWQRMGVLRGATTAVSPWGARRVRHEQGAPVLVIQTPGIYVHAKLMVVDDVFLSVGSSNLNRRGLHHDGEINAFAVPQSLKSDPRNPALRLRCRLWAEHLGLTPEMGLSLLADPLSALAYFDRSWYRGNRWQPFRFGEVADPPAFQVPTSGEAAMQILGLAEGLIPAAELSTIWAAFVDPTTSTDPDVAPGDRGPHLS